MECVCEVESYIATSPITNVLHITQLAKFMIQCDAGDSVEAERSLRALLTNPETSYEKSSNALLKLLQQTTFPSSHAAELFTLLLAQYPKYVRYPYVLTTSHRLINVNIL